LEEYDEYTRLRAVQLVDRKNTSLQLLDFIHNQKKIQHLFEDSEMTFNYKKVILAGHSFGGATACETAYQDERVTGGLLLFDPWLAPCSEQVYTTPLNKPVLLLRSETFDKSERFKLEPWKFIQAHEKGQGLVVSGYFRGSTHHSSSDLMLHLPREFVMFKMFKSMNTLGEQLLSHRTLAQIFLDSIVNEDDTTKEKSLKTHVLSRYREHLQKTSRPDILEVDDILLSKN